MSSSDRAISSCDPEEKPDWSSVQSFHEHRIPNGKAWWPVVILCKLVSALLTL